MNQEQLDIRDALTALNAAHELVTMASNLVSRHAPAVVYPAAVITSRIDNLSTLLKGEAARYDDPLVPTEDSYSCNCKDHSCHNCTCRSLHEMGD